ncbi:MAG: SDR family NAD(P)-dependent oxidoreductase [Candidatus Rokuibacteriota bacterium]
MARQETDRGRSRRLARPARAGGTATAEARPLADRAALVTGGSGGIGRAIALSLAAAGATVIVNFRRGRRAATDCVAAVRRLGGTAEAVRADVTRPAEVARMFGWIDRRFGRLDVLVANAGIAPPAPGLGRVSLGAWRRTLETNVTGVFLCLREAAPRMARRRWGRVVLVGSLAGSKGGTIGPHYAASKAALLGLMQWSVRELAPFGVTVNVVAPGFVETALSAHAYATPRARAAMTARVPLGRVGTPQEIGALVAYLAGPAAGYITGECITIAGGR